MTMLSIFDGGELVEAMRETFVRYYVDGRLHGKPPERPPWGIYATREAAIACAVQVLADEYKDGGVVSVSEVFIYADTYEGASSSVAFEVRR